MQKMNRFCGQLVKQPKKPFFMNEQNSPKKESICSCINSNACKKRKSNFRIHSYYCNQGCFFSGGSFTNYLVKTRYRQVLKVAFFQMHISHCPKNLPKTIEITFCLESADSNCTAVSKGGKIQNTKLGIEHSTFFGCY